LLLVNQLVNLNTLLQSTTINDVVRDQSTTEC
jgi:hypothetical protein